MENKLPVWTKCITSWYNFFGKYSESVEVSQKNGFGDALAYVYWNSKVLYYTLITGSEVQQEIDWMKSKKKKMPI